LVARDPVFGDADRAAALDILVLDGARALDVLSRHGAADDSRQGGGGPPTALSDRIGDCAARNRPSTAPPPDDWLVNWTVSLLHT